MNNLSSLCILILQGEEKGVCIADAFERNYPNINMFKRSDVNPATQRSYTANVKYSLTCLIATPIPAKQCPKELELLFKMYIVCQFHERTANTLFKYENTNKPFQD